MGARVHRLPRTRGKLEKASFKYLSIPKVGCYVIGAMTELNGEYLMHCSAVERSKGQESVSGGQLGSWSAGLMGTSLAMLTNWEAPKDGMEMG